MSNPLRQNDSASPSDSLSETPIPPTDGTAEHTPPFSDAPIPNPLAMQPPGRVPSSNVDSDEEEITSGDILADPSLSAEPASPSGATDEMISPLLIAATSPRKPVRLPPMSAQLPSVLARRLPSLLAPPQRRSQLHSQASPSPPSTSRGVESKESAAPSVMVHLTPQIPQVLSPGDGTIGDTSTGSVFPLSKSPGLPAGPSLSVPSTIDDDEEPWGPEDELITPMTALPPAFSGAKDLRMPPMIKKGLANVTLPSRLALIGRRSFRVLAALFPHHVGNSVLGYAQSSYDPRKKSLYILPWLFSRYLARIAVLIRILLLLLLALLVVDFFNVATIDVGRVWIIGTGLALFVLIIESTFRRVPDGTMAFCRSIGAPQMEEFMFSYSWKAEPDNVRTLAKAVWDSGVGVWIDVLKLTPGDEIRPLVRTIAARVYKVVIFLSPAYCTSPNCAVEFVQAIQRPDNCLVCVVEPVDDSIMAFIKGLHIPIVNGFPELMAEIDRMISAHDPTAFDWWRSQQISGAGVPERTVPDGWSIPRFSLTGKLRVTAGSLTVGPAYLAGDCASQGWRVAPPIILGIACLGVGINFWDLYDKMQGGEAHSVVDWIWLSALACCNLFPFFSFPSLLETRVGPGLSVCLQPLLASKSVLGGGIHVRIVGRPELTQVKALRGFVKTIGHAAVEEDTVEQFVDKLQQQEKQRKHTPLETASSSSPVVSDDPAAKHLSPLSPVSPLSPPALPAREPVVTVYVMNELSDRALLFGRADPYIFDEYSLFVWVGSANAFTPDEIGKRMMKFLVMVAAWDKHELAENIFNAVGVRAVDLLHNAVKLD